MIFFFIFLFSKVSLCDQRKITKEGELPIGKRLLIDTQEEQDLNQKEFANLDSSEMNGGAIYCSKTNVTLQGCKFASIKGSIGGAIYMYQTKISGKLVPLYCNIINCQFTNCVGLTNGGAAYLANTQPNSFKMSIEDCTFTSNEAQNGGAIYGKVRDQLVIKGCTFTNNKATVNGSSLWLLIGNKNGKDTNDTHILTNNKFLVGSDSASNVYIANNPLDSGIQLHACVYIGGCTFGAENPTNPSYKNLVFVACPSGFKDIGFTSCNCFKQGRSSLSIPSKFGFNNIDFECNSIDSCSPDAAEEPSIPEETPKPQPDVDGYIPSDRIASGPINLTKYKFTNINSEGLNGGAINIYKANCVLIDCKFDSCHGKDGGALYVSLATSKFQVKVSSCEFTKCVAKGNGGAIYAKSTQSEIHEISISSTTFRSNKAVKGGACYLEVRDNFAMNNCLFDINEASRIGSSIWCQIGWDRNKANYSTNTAIFNGNTFLFTPTENSVNVYIQNKDFNASECARNAVLKFGLSRFNAIKNVDFAYKHLQIANIGAGFESIIFTNCVCIDKDKNTVSLPQGYSDDSFTYDCKAFDSCKPDSDGYKNHDQINDEVRTEPINLESYKFVGYQNDKDGGAIAVSTQKTSCFIKKCKFDSCGTKYNGGAIYLKYVGRDDTYICTIDNSLFINNEAKYNGGAIYVEITQSDLHSITITNSRFETNKATQKGGAIYASVRDSFTVDKCHFENNDAKTEGSSIWCKIGWYDRYNQNAAVVTNNEFIFTPSTNNKPVNVYFESYGLEAEVSPNANLTLTGNIFKSLNTSVEYLHLKIKAPSEYDVMNFIPCNCIEQGIKTVSLPYSYHPIQYFGFECQKLDTCTPGQAPEPPTPDTDGYIKYDRLELNIEPKLKLVKSKFTNIETNRYGGGLSLIKVSCDINDCKFDTIKSTYKNTKNGGGAIYISYTGKDGAVYSCHISNCIFNKCETMANGGGIAIYITQTKRHSAVIEKCTFSNNKANYNGGGIYAECRDLLTIKSNTFTNNKATNGSSLWSMVGWYNGRIERNNALELLDNKFDFDATEQKYSVYITSNNLQDGINPNANLFIDGNQFSSSNINGENQKHLFIFENGTFQSILFSECNCVQGGENTVSIIAANQPNIKNGIKFNCNNMDQCTPGSEEPPSSDDKCNHNRERIENKEYKGENHCFSNLVSKDGAAIKAVDAKLEIKQCTFRGCSSIKNGGAIYSSYSNEECTFIIESCTFENCYSGSIGGAIYFYNIYASKSSINNCKFTNNTAALNAGALYFAPCANSRLTNCQFVNNTCGDQNDSHGSTAFILIRNTNSNSKNSLKLMEENHVFIDGNNIVSEPTKNGRQMLIDLKQTGDLKLGNNAFSFNGAEVDKSSYSRFLQLQYENGANFDIAGEICLDSNEENSHLISGIYSKIKYNCKYESPQPPKKGKNLGLIIGVTVAAVVVVVIIVVVVIFILKRRNKNKYVSDLNEENESANDAELASQV